MNYNQSLNPHFQFNSALSLSLHNMKRPELRQIGSDLRLPATVLNSNKSQLVERIMTTVFSSPHFLTRFDLSAFEGCPLLKKSLAEAYKKFVSANPSYSMIESSGMFPHSMMSQQQPIFRTTTSNYQGEINGAGQPPPQTPYGLANGAAQTPNVCLNSWLQCKWSGKPGGVQIACKAQGCSRKFHAECLKIHESSVEKEARTFECPYCVLGKNDPLSEISSVLLEPFIVVSGEQKQFIIDQMRLQQIKEDPCVGVEIRCLKLDYKYLNEQTWLDSGELFLNMRRVCEFKPLQMNSALKKRKDEKFFYREHLLVINSIKFQDIKPNYEQKPNVRYDESAIYMAGVFLVRKLRADELITKIQSTCVKDPNVCKSSIFNELENNSFALDECKISIDKVSLSLSDAFDKQTIKTPARTAFCSHLQCFSLENLVKVMEATVPKKWRCPICKVKAFDLVIDGYIWEIIQGISNKEMVSEIVFLRNGTYEIKNSKNEENNENEGDFNKRNEEENNGSNREEAKKPVENPANLSKKASVLKPEIIILDEDEEETPQINQITEENRGENAASNQIGEVVPEQTPLTNNNSNENINNEEITNKMDKISVNHEINETSVINQINEINKTQDKNATNESIHEERSLTNQKDKEKDKENTLHSIRAPQTSFVMSVNSEIENENENIFHESNLQIEIEILDNDDVMINEVPQPETKEPNKNHQFLHQEILIPLEEKKKENSHNNNNLISINNENIRNNNKIIPQENEKTMEYEPIPKKFTMYNSGLIAQKDLSISHIAKAPNDSKLFPINIEEIPNILNKKPEKMVLEPRFPVNLDEASVVNVPEKPTKRKYEAIEKDIKEKAQHVNQHKTIKKVKTFSEYTTMVQENSVCKDEEQLSVSLNNSLKSKYFIVKLYKKHFPENQREFLLKASLQNPANANNSNNANTNNNNNNNNHNTNGNNANYFNSALKNNSANLNANMHNNEQLPLNFHLSSNNINSNSANNSLKNFKSPKNMPHFPNLIGPAFDLTNPNLFSPMNIFAANEKNVLNSSNSFMNFPFNAHTPMNLFENNSKNTGEELNSQADLLQTLNNSFFNKAHKQLNNLLINDTQESFSNVKIVKPKKTNNFMHSQFNNNNSNNNGININNNRKFDELKNKGLQMNDPICLDD